MLSASCGARRGFCAFDCLKAAFLVGFAVALARPALLAARATETPPAGWSPARSAILEPGAAVSKHPAPVAVRIDVLPGESENLVDPAAGGPIPVAIHGRADLDATSIDPSTVVL